MKIRCLFGHKWEPWQQRRFGSYAMDTRICPRCLKVETAEVDNTITRIVQMAEALAHMENKRRRFH